MNVKVFYFLMIKCLVFSFIVNYVIWKFKCLMDYYVLLGSDLVLIIEKNFWGSCYFFWGIYGVKILVYEVL